MTSFTETTALTERSERDDSFAPLGDSLALDPRLLERLVCPVTKGPLTYDRQRNVLLSPEAQLAYPVRDGIPIMLPEEATPY